MLEELKSRVLTQLDMPRIEKRHIDQADLTVLNEVADRLKDNFPFHHPMYAGQMLKPPHPIAKSAYAMAMELNPNNHALDGGKASSDMEKEAVAEIASMMELEKHLGHLTGGGTMANMEALWVASKIHPGKKVVASDQAHYTHERLTQVLQISFEQIPSDLLGRMDLLSLEEVLQRGDVGTVVVTMGTTSCGAVDPLNGILKLKEKYRFRIHIDAAYGGYFKLTSKSSDYVRDQFSQTSQADSIVIDPHKHGLQPYGCGCILFKDPSVGKYYKHDSPYTYFSSEQLHLGEISLECSRPGAAAVALWATQRQLPLIAKGEFAQGLDASLTAAWQLYRYLKYSGKFLMFFPPELDIVLWAPKGKSLREISSSSALLFEACAQQDLHLALYQFPASQLNEQWNHVEKDMDHVVCLRSVLMKPQHLPWIEVIFNTIDSLVE